MRSLILLMLLVALAQLSQPLTLVDAATLQRSRVPQANEIDPDAERTLKRHGKRDIRVHDPSSIVKCGDEYWLFSTGVGLRTYRSPDLKDWKPSRPVFDSVTPWIKELIPTQRGHYWAPDVIKLDDRYLLYYSISSFGKNKSAIALATNRTLDPANDQFQWRDEGIVIQSNFVDDFNAIDPAIIQTTSGELWMSFGSYWSGLKLVQLDPDTGKRLTPDNPLVSLAYNKDIEAAHIFEHDGWFYLFLNWGKCCRGVNSTYEIRVGRSRQITGPYLDHKGTDLRQGGGTLLLDSEGAFIGPGHPNVTRLDDRFLFHCHFYDGSQRGRSRLAMMDLKWVDGWPKLLVPKAQSKSAANPDEKSNIDDQSAIPIEWIDPKTGHRVVRLSKLPGSLSMYFHQNGYTPDGKELLITTPRGLELVDLETRDSRLIVPRGRFRIGGSSGVEVGRKTRQVYYTARDDQGTVVRATHLDTLQTKDVARLPRGASFGGVNADETLLFGKIYNRPFRRGENQERAMQLMTANLQTGQIETFHASNQWLNHMQCSPTDPLLGLFCHEGPWHDVDRVWTIRFGAEDAVLMHERQQQYDIAGHEFFSPNGEWVWYDLQTPRASEFWLAGVRISDGERIRYRLEREHWSVHYNASHDGKLFAGDGGGPSSVANQTPLPEKRRLSPPRNGQWIYLFRPGSEFEPCQISGQPGKSGFLIAERLVDLSDHDYSLEPNVTFTPDGKWIVFRSNMGGERHVYKVEVKRSQPTD